MQWWEGKTEYLRHFTRLKGLQAGYSLRYRLRPQAGVWWLSLTRSDGQDCQLELRCSRLQAEQLLCFLYENAVQPEHAAALVEDLAGEALT